MNRSKTKENRNLISLRSLLFFPSILLRFRFLSRSTMEKSAGVWKPRVRFPCCWTISKAAISSKFFSSLNVSMMRLINSKMHVFYMNINISTGKVNSSFEYFLIFDPIIVSYLRIRRNESNGIDILFRERLVVTAYIRNLLFL